MEAKLLVQSPHKMITTLSLNEAPQVAPDRLLMLQLYANIT